MQPERFVEAVQVPESGLTHTSLVGSRKQSVEDVECLFGHALIEFMEEKQYSNEANYLKVIRNWRRAVDERDLPCRYVIEFLKCEWVNGSTTLVLLIIHFFCCLGILMALKVSLVKFWLLSSLTLSLESGDHNTLIISESLYPIHGHAPQMM